ncbi:MAG: type I-MYXAN CRISPR-associated endonuclease Cas1 [Leptospiraceae bacterium]|nr:type I-MYXAN CRISPR-associated endonuclease Cas1 [Leptospiraceae bacterium]
MGIHSITYCERLFFLEEVEGILLADQRVYEGRKLHEEIQVENSDIHRIETFEYTSEKLGLTGKVDRLQKRDGEWIPYEHKKGRSKTDGKVKTAWEPDLLQVVAYAMLIEEESGREIKEARVKYHYDNALVKIPITEELKKRVQDKIIRAKTLYEQIERPPVSSNYNLCLKCSLAPVCLPEENRIIDDKDYPAIRLFPPSRDKKVIHVMGYNSFIKKQGDTIVLEKEVEHQKVKETLPMNEIESVVIHGGAQISSQLINYLAYHNIPIHWFTGGGNYVGGLNFNTNNVKRKLRQYDAFKEKKFCLYLTQKVAIAKCESQIRYMLRSSRGKNKRTIQQEESIRKVRELIPEISKAESQDSIRGYEGIIAKYYFQYIPSILIDSVPKEMFPEGRSKRPPKDRFNAALSFLYHLLFRSVQQAIIAVGLEGSLSFFHSPRTGAEPLVLDLMELFRVPLCDIPLIGSINRLSWDIKEDFLVTKEKVWLSEQGRKKAIKIYESRLNDKWKHPVTNYSMTYYSLIELEVRLLEKEWSDKKGLFAKARLR